MRKTILIILSFLFLSCANHYQPQDFDTESIFAESIKILQEHSGNTGNVHAEEWPPLFGDIGAKSVILRDDGLYILLNSFFVEEKGLFIPKAGENVIVGSEYDPSYKELKNGVYSYIIKG